MKTDLKDIHIGEIIYKRVNEIGIDLDRICSNMNLHCFIKMQNSGMLSRQACINATKSKLLFVLVFSSIHNLESLAF